LADAETTAKVINRGIFCTFGLPAEILSDKGSHFANKTILKPLQNCKGYS